jgi:hypothetical protein
MKRLLFIHIPKTGGSYLQQVMNQANSNIIDLGHNWYDDVHCIGWESWNKRPNIRFLPMIPSRELREISVMYGYGGVIKEDDYIFTIVRNPFDLLCSYYFHGDNKWHNGWANCNNIHRIKDFEHFIKLYCDDETQWHFPVLKENLYSQIYREGELIIDEYIKFEGLSENVRFFSENHGLKLNLEVQGRINQSSRRELDYRVYYTDKMVDLVTPKLNVILETFDYNFE